MANRLTGQQYQDGTRLTNTYDANSQRTVLSDWTGSYTSTYDPDGRLSSVVNPAGLAITYGYDGASQRTTMNQPTGLFTYNYDSFGRIATLTNPENQVSSFSYDAASRVTANLLANGTQASYTYDNADRVLLLANLTTGGTTLSSFNYTYDPIGNRTQVVESNGDVVTWSYDPTYQLTNEQRSGVNSYNISYTYDPVGNRTLMLNGGAPTSYTYNAANELTTLQASAGVTTNTYDGDGNLLTSLAAGNQLTTNIWDGENRLTQVSLPSRTVDVFVYNGDGQRVQKQDSTGTTKHVWDGQNILLETSASNAIQVVYTLEPAIFGNLISQSRSGVDSFYLFDALGSARQLANSAGSVTDSYLYDSFGNILLTSGSTINWFRYIGFLGCYYNLDLVNYYLRARYYNMAVAGFLSRDPSAFVRLPNMQLVTNYYYYARNNPVGFNDPSGLDEPPLIPPLLPPSLRPPPPPPPPPPPNLTSNPLTFGYGRYCGGSRNGPGDPIDALDWACRKHDKCQATWWTCNPYHIVTCSTDLCYDAYNAWQKGCQIKYVGQTQKLATCLAASKDVMNFFCPLGLIYPPYLPQPEPIFGPNPPGGGLYG